jgi:SAM-dependent methyltransferase
MIAAARRRFAREAWTLDVADARSLPFANQSFDVALFSYCGIDYVDHRDRLKVLSEVRRVLAPGALFAFSTHNLQRARDLFEGAACDGRRRRLWQLLGALRRARLRRANPPLEELDQMPHAVINDGAFRFAATTYHIRPRAQVGQLEHAGFESVRVLSAASGSALSDDAARASTEPWLMYLARRS